MYVLTKTNLWFIDHFKHFRT